jgi:S-adenosylmethionine:tRNA ribosyltransferase-isomerase
MDFKIDIDEYTYELPPDRIALFPLEQRDQSKLLVYSNGEITHRQFRSLPELLPENALLFFNDTKVIPARIIFQKETGAEIEIFLLNPENKQQLLQEAMQVTRTSTWTCTIGNLKRWPEGSVLSKKSESVTLTAKLIDRTEGIVQFQWEPNSLSFAEVINEFGNTPLPPYIKRDIDDKDKDRYQTVYSHYEGAVAAPTAGLHFSDDVLSKIKAKGIITDFLTLHVSAGTFQPVKVQNAAEHVMHAEQIVVTRQNIENLLLPGKNIVAVGTTSLRTLESLYWHGVKLLQNESNEFIINQFDPYSSPEKELPTRAEALTAVLHKLDKSSVSFLSGTTSIYILPGYSFKIVDCLITNFHQPGSTLMLLVAAFAGDNWKTIYREALTTDYRFLSYGDSSLLMR